MIFLLNTKNCIHESKQFMWKKILGILRSVLLESVINTEKSNPCMSYILVNVFLSPEWQAWPRQVSYECHLSMSHAASTVCPQICMFHVLTTNHIISLFRHQEDLVHDWYCKMRNVSQLQDASKGELLRQVVSYQNFSIFLVRISAFNTVHCQFNWTKWVVVV